MILRIIISLFLVCPISAYSLQDLLAQWAEKKTIVVQQDADPMVIEQSVVQSILQSFNEYILNASWVTECCFGLTLSEFEIVWTEIVRLLTCVQDRWFYFAPQKEIYCGDYKKCLWQCRIYDEWLHAVAVDQQTKHFFFIPSEHKKSYTSLAKYIANSAKNDGTHPIHIFYAFYIDCLTQLFQEYIEEMRLCSEEKEVIEGYRKLTKKTLETIERLLPYIKRTPLYVQYQQAYKTLKQVYSLAREEYDA